MSNLHRELTCLGSTLSYEAGTQRRDGSAAYVLSSSCFPRTFGTTPGCHWVADLRRSSPDRVVPTEDLVDRTGREQAADRPVHRLGQRDIITPGCGT